MPVSRQPIRIWGIVVRPGQNEAQCRSILHSGCSRAQFALQQGIFGDMWALSAKKLCQIWLTHRNYVQTSQTWLLITGIFYLPSALEIAKNGTDSVWVLLLTGPLCPWWTGLSQATRGTPLRERTFPPSDSIRFFSEGTSGLWSAVRGTACSFFSLLNRPRAAPESPTWAMYSVLPLKITTVAVVPDVLGSPCLVRGQESSRKKKR